MEMSGDELNGLVYMPGYLMDPRLKAQADAQTAEYNNEVNRAPKHVCHTGRRETDGLIIYWRGKWQLWDDGGDGDCEHDILYCPYCGEKLEVAQ